MAFDRLNRLKKLTDPDLGETDLTYDARDNLSSLTDAEDLTTSFVLNGFGDVICQTSPDTGVTDYVVNAMGLVTSKTDARGIVPTDQTTILHLLRRLRTLSHE